MFALNTFVASFDRNVLRIQRAEKITRALVSDMSRDVLFAVHETGDISYINKLMAVLTPMNKRTFALFGKEFTGFVFDDTTNTFTKKSKKEYDGAKNRSMTALEDPHFNLWTWSDKNVKLEAAPLDLSKVTQFIKQTLKRAAKEGIDQSAVIEAVFAAGMDADALIAVLGKMDIEIEEA